MENFVTDKSNEKQQIRVFTLNCWGLPCFSKNKKCRITAIAEYLSSSDLDIVCLQEIWSKKDYLYISKKCFLQLPYSHYFNSFIIGSGLCIFSKHPISDVYFHQWPINGYAHKIHQGDWLAGKGVAFARIKIKDLVVNVYNAHLHAEYNIHGTEYLSHRVLQAFDTSQFIRLTIEDCDLAVLAGDLNTEPDDLAIKILNQNAQLTDCYFVAQKKTLTFFGTNESTRNSYAPKSEVKRLPQGKRIDYILYRNSRKINVEVQNYQFPLPEKVPGCTHSYSDHEGVEVLLQYGFDSALKGRGPEGNSYELQLTLETAIDVCNDALHKLRVAQKTYLTLSILFGVLIIVSWFAELFFYIPLDIGGYQVASTKSNKYYILYKTYTLGYKLFFYFSLLFITIRNIKFFKCACVSGKVRSCPKLLLKCISRIALEEVKNCLFQVLPL
ncbi:sphingomyelin phosphodiesterase, putative [Pediculus humanus corporis]|uniref:sphingomyelin phosphodiesterase n=1 Tax=Pediculus humanus subsp. corporis TaxID=121224 RepID=E0VDN6_PEDHC|nr:sphingomyelin phosphodiesterase, putative [Pediculus humanus corporis]EEB11492.1 sphingomyelin phosphodiesterase, putative [Pediculus humanus corporis]